MVEHLPELLYYTIFAFGLIVLLLLSWGVARAWRAVKWQEQVEPERRRLLVRLSQTNPDFTGFEAMMAGYSQHDPEPYQPIVRELLQKLAWMQSARAELVGQLQSSPAPPSEEASPIFQFWMMVWAGYRFWRQQTQLLKKAGRTIQQLERELAKAAASAEKLQALPLQVAGQAQKLRASLKSCLDVAYSRIMTDGRARTLSETVSAMEQLQAELQGLPVYFFDPSNRSIIRQARTADVGRAWAVLQRLEPRVDEQIKAFNDWQERYRIVEQALVKLERRIAATRSDLAAVDNSININSLVSKSGQARDMAYQSGEMYLARRIDTSRQFLKQVSGIGEAIDRLGKQAREIQRDFKRLAELFREITSSLSQLETLLGEESRAKNYVNWEPFQAELAGLRKTEASIGKLLKGRWTPEQLAAHLRQVSQLHGSALNFKRKVGEAKSYAPKLKSLLAEPILTASANWLNRVIALQERIGTYNPADWPQEYGVPQLQNDANTLLNRRQKLLAEYTPNKRIAADRLNQASLTKISQLIEALTAFQERLEAIEQRIIFLQDKQQDIQRELKEIREAIEHLGRQWAALPFLRQRPIARQYAGWEKWVQSSYSSPLFNPGRRPAGLTKRTSEIDQWAKAGLKELEYLLRALPGEIKYLEDELSRSVKKLEETARFDKEPGMVKAKKLVDRKRSQPSYRDRLPKNRPDQLVYLIKNVAMSQLVELGELYETGEQLKASLINPLSEQAARLEQLQQQVAQQLAKLQELKRAPALDPAPLQRHLQRADKTEDQLRRKQKALKSGGSTLPEVLTRSGEIIQQYEQLSRELEAVIQEISKQLPEEEGETVKN